MPNELAAVGALLDWNILGGFLLTLTRLGLAIAFVPLPGVKSVPEMARIVLVVSLAACQKTLRRSVVSSAVAHGLYVGTDL